MLAVAGSQRNRSCLIAEIELTDAWSLLMSCLTPAHLTARAIDEALPLSLSIRGWTLSSQEALTETSRTFETHPLGRAESVFVVQMHFAQREEESTTSMPRASSSRVKMSKSFRANMTFTTKSSLDSSVPFMVTHLGTDSHQCFLHSVLVTDSTTMQQLFFELVLRHLQKSMKV